MSPPPAMTMPSSTATVASASDTSPPGGSRTGRPPLLLMAIPYVEVSGARPSDQPRQLALMWYVVMPIVGAICPLRGDEKRTGPPSKSPTADPGGDSPAPPLKRPEMGKGGELPKIEVTSDAPAIAADRGYY